MLSFLTVIDMALGMYIWMLVISAIISWLAAFNIVNMRNPVVAAVSDFLYRLTEPVLRRVRKFVPLVNGIDLSPVIVIFAIIFLRLLIRNNIVDLLR